MKKSCYKLFTLFFTFMVLISNSGMAQVHPNYIAPQDTVQRTRKPGESLNKIGRSDTLRKIDTRLLGAAVKAAALLSDTTRYNLNRGIKLEELFRSDDLDYLAKQGLPSMVTLFEQVNKHLPAGLKLDFLSDSIQTIQHIQNPLVLDNLRVRIGKHPASLATDIPQWQEHVYEAYKARDYGTKLENTITTTSATREIRETPSLSLIDFDGGEIRLSEILQQEKARTTDKYLAEKNAVLSFRRRTFPGAQLDERSANENYRRALLTLISLQETDFQRHAETQMLLDELSADLAEGAQSKSIRSLRQSSFFDANVPGNLGPVLLTESQLINPGQISGQSKYKALELFSLTALHFGERDARKLFTRLLNGQGSLPANQGGEFTAKRLNEMRYHGVEKMKSLGFGPDKTEGMTFADLVLVAVAAPETPKVFIPETHLSLTKVSGLIVNHYHTSVIAETRNTIQLNPRISLGSRHIEYRASFDPVEFVPEYDASGERIDQRGSRITQNGLELRLESDIYFSKLEKMLSKERKPVIYPEFGVLVGGGKRRVGYDKNTIQGPQGPVPKFDQNYLNWGSHIGLNIGPVLLGMDATILSSPTAADPYQHFFDLSQAMTYFRYTMQIHVFNLDLRKSDPLKPIRLSLDLQVSGETNNEGTIDRTRTQGGSSQTGSKEWLQDFERAHPAGVYDHEIATQMILNGDVKASYAASNFGAVSFGLSRSGFQFKVSAGLYNLRAIERHEEGRGKWLGQLAENTIKGNFFGAAGLTYNFGSMRSNIHHSRAESYHTDGQGNSSTPRIEESSNNVKTSSGLQHRAVFMNDRK